MFSSNQILKISGTLTEKSIKKALKYALYSYEGKTGKKRFKNSSPFCGLCKQLTEDGKYYVGWSPKHSDGSPCRRDGWERYPEGTTMKDICYDIYHILAQAEIEEGVFDGSYHHGFLMEAVPEFVGNDSMLQNPVYGIVSFTPYTNFYSK